MSARSAPAASILLVDDKDSLRAMLRLALEAQGYDADPLAGNRWLDGWNPTLLAASGADAAKLLVLYRKNPDAS